jgi:phosphate transport system ATP-binding protein
MTSTLVPSRPTLGGAYTRPAAAPLPEPAVSIRGFDLHYGAFHALQQVSMEIPDRQVTALIGPSGCGKSTLLRSINRMNDLVPGVRVSGQITVKGVEAYGAGMSTDVLRRHVGMVFQRPNPFPLSVLDNLAYGPRLDGRLAGGKARELAESLLTEVGLWEALRDRLDRSALLLSPEQQQRLCIARALATRPAVLLMDEPCSALDPEATARVEELMLRLSAQHAVVVVTHNMQQAQRVASHCGFMLMGELVEFGAADYVAGRFG